MQPIVTPAEMARIDAAAPEPAEVLIDRAGWAVARAAAALLGPPGGRPGTGGPDRGSRPGRGRGGGRYGARVLVLAGKGNNGNDGRVAARHLARWGVRCRIEGPDFPPPPALLASLDLVIDAAYGTGLRGGYVGPDVGAVPVLAVDIPSGVDGLTGVVEGRPLAATATVTFAAVKPGLLLHPGRVLAGPVEVADIGLDCVTGCRTWHLGPEDVEADDRAGGPAPGTGWPWWAGWPAATAVAHKWQRAVWVVGGHDSMLGAPSLAAAAAARAGAGYVAVSVPGSAVSGPPLPVESVIRVVPERWGDEVVANQNRFDAVVLGPGLPTDRATQGEVLAVVAGTGSRGLVLDGGALDAVAGVAAHPEVLRRRAVPAVLTPHDGELRRLLGGRDPGPDRIGTARRLAAHLGVVVLSKGPTTVAAHADGRVLVSTAGDQRLASAGTGDVLAGLVGAALAGGLEPLLAAGLAAELHGRAARLGHQLGFAAGDLPLLVARWLDGDRPSDHRHSHHLLPPGALP